MSSGPGAITGAFLSNNVAGADKRLASIVKRAGDLLGASILLLLLAPLIVLSAIVIRLTSRGPAFYAQTRLGRGGKPFRLYKLRTMTHGCETITGARWALPNDPRVTLFGRFLRRTQLDNLPQLWNVLKGDMSLVGPRPERPEFVPILEASIPNYRCRRAVRPGLTGMAQAYCPTASGLKSISRKLAFDLHYICSFGPLLDLRLLVAAAFRMLGLPRNLARRLCLLPSPTRIEEVPLDAGS
jgi:lipopolysaccharide/colanic/teichoic acid biosynthesis glycosyltransferase